MNVRKAMVYIENPADPDWGEDVTAEMHLIGDEWTLEGDGPEWTFRKVTGSLEDGTPKINIGVCPRFNMDLDYEVSEIDLNWLMGAKLMEIVETLAKK